MFVLIDSAAEIFIESGLSVVATVQGMRLLTDDITDLLDKPCGEAHDLCLLGRSLMFSFLALFMIVGIRGV